MKSQKHEIISDEKIENIHKCGVEVDSVQNTRCEEETFHYSYPRAKAEDLWKDYEPDEVFFESYFGSKDIDSVLHSKICVYQTQ